MIALVNLKSLYYHIYIRNMCWPNYKSKISSSNCIFSFEFRSSYWVKSNFATSNSPLGSMWIRSEIIFLFSFVAKAMLYVHFKKQNHSIIFIKGGKGSILTNSTWGTKIFTSYLTLHCDFTSSRPITTQKHTLNQLIPHFLCFWDLNQIRKAFAIHLLIRTKSFCC